MEERSFIGCPSNDYRVLYGRVNVKFYLGLAEVCRYGGTTGQRELQFTGFVKHPLGFVPTVGEMFVIEDRYGALALFENPDNLLIHPPARQEPLPFEVRWIFSVFSDDDNAIDSKLLAPKRNGLAYLFKDRNVFCLAYFLTQLT